MRFSDHYHRLSKSRSVGCVDPFPPEKEWPDSWKNILYKTYERLPRVALPQGECSGEVAHILLQHESVQPHHVSNPIGLNELSALLRYACGVSPRQVEGSGPGRVYPSAGKRYPLEVYVAAWQDIGPEAKGLFHYEVESHSLVRLTHLTTKLEDLKKCFVTHEWIQRTAFVIILTAHFERVQQKYGERGYRMALIEAGHLGQNVHIMSRQLGLGCSAFLGTHDEGIEACLRIDGVSESFVYALGISKNDQ